jgi:hypothetical protein
MEDTIYKVYIKTDDSGRVSAVNSSAFLSDITGWIEIDEGTGDKYHHAQGNYLSNGLMTEDGIYQYKYVDGELQERTAEEIQKERDARPPVPEVMTLEEITAALNALAGGEV